MTKSVNEPKAETKAGRVEGLLRGKNGATQVEIMDATGWQPHTVRAFLSGVRKRGLMVLKEQRKDGVTCYRIGRAVLTVAAAAEAVA